MPSDALYIAHILVPVLYAFLNNSLLFISFVTWYAQVWNAMMIFGEDLYIVYQRLHCTMTVV